MGERHSPIFSFAFSWTLVKMNPLFSTSFSCACFQTGDDHSGCHWRRGALLHPAGSAGLLPPEAKEAQEEGDDEEDPARTRGGLLVECKKGVSKKFTLARTLEYRLQTK